MSRFGTAGESGKWRWPLGGGADGDDGLAVDEYNTMPTGTAAPRHQPLDLGRHENGQALSLCQYRGVPVQR